MKGIAYSILAISLILTACGEFKQGEGNLRYKIHEDKNGPTIKEGDFIGFVATEKTEEDSVIYNSDDYGRPTYMFCGKPMFEGDLTSGLNLLSEGDSATLKIDINSMVEIGRARPANTKEKYFIYNLRITDVVSKGTLSDSAFKMKVDERMLDKIKRWEKEEPLKIKKFLVLNKLEPLVTPSGLIYHIFQEGKGMDYMRGDSVDVHYTIKLFSGKIIDSTLPETVKKWERFDYQRPDGPLRWSEGLGSRFYPPSFNEGVTMFPEGTKARLIIPSVLAYEGEGGNGIPPYIPLVVDIEILKIIPNHSGNWLD
ncbi:MAG: FKBP-type peptidyl-prolyl cis-trans isomerase [Prolixibacteraceae bacterium]|jgi:FKBP-type peptidyl-prolyl cis-trans isomerase|nr:FKBP-type peptidyl-prolyl cis-trans isomerase [Prolixibacteraceae bacterium]